MPDGRSVGPISISVVIPVRNSENTIQRAVHSVLDQVYPALEIVVVDDCSEDETTRRVSELQEDRVVLIDGEGQGVAAARNAGIGRARGEWVGFLDGDDFWKPEFLDLVRRRIALDPDALACFGAATPVNDDGVVIGRHDMKEVVTLDGLVRGRIGPTTSATLVRQEALDRCGGFFEGFKCAAGVEDLDLWWRIAAAGKCVGVSTPAVVYVVHDDRDRSRSTGELTDREHDRALMVDRFAATGQSPALVRRGRAIMRARMGSYWLRAENPAAARAAARSSLRTLPTLEGVVMLVVASMPQFFAGAAVRLRRRYRASLSGKEG